MTVASLVAPLASGPEGRERRVGVEIELNNIAIDAICDAIQEVYGGRVGEASEVRGTVHTEHGEFEVLYDASWALKLGDSEECEEASPTDRLLKSLADLVVPLEIAAPPVPMGQLVRMDDLVVELARRGARGTHDRVLNAFGVHFNPELPSLEATCILTYLRTFLVLRDWFLHTIDVDLSRRVTPFIDRYPNEYALLVLDPSYAPDVNGLIDDYVRFNPSRNRALDLLPLLAFLDEPRVRGELPNEKINSRPTFHYRMANSRVGESGWRITDEWRAWLEVEKLVVDPPQLAALMSDYRKLLENPVKSLFTDWGATVQQRLEDHGE